MIRSTIDGMSVHGLESNSRVRTDGLGILVGLTLCGSTGVLSVVGKLVSVTVCSNGIRVDDTGTTTSDHSPDTTLSIEDSQLEGSTGGTVEFLDVSFFLGQVTTEGGGPDLQSSVRTPNTCQTH